MPGGGAAPRGLRSGVFPAAFPNSVFPGKGARAKPLPSPKGSRSSPGPGAHAGGEAVGGGGLVDLVGMGLGVGAPRCRLSLAPARGAAVHHAGRGGELALLARERVALVCHHPAHGDRMEEGKDHPAPSSSQPQTARPIPKLTRILTLNPNLIPIPIPSLYQTYSPSPHQIPLPTQNPLSFPSQLPSSLPSHRDPLSHPCPKPHCPSCPGSPLQGTG